MTTAKGQSQVVNQRTSPQEQQPTEGYEVVPDTMKCSRTVRGILKAIRKKLGYKRRKTIFQALRNVKDDYNHTERTGVYNFDTGTDKAYIGATQRNLHDRLEEHKRDVRQGNLTTALARRAYENKVKINWNDARIIRNISDLVEVSTVEKLSIFKRSQTERIINDIEAVSNTWKYALRH